MFLDNEFLGLYEELSELNEAKADIQRLIDFAGEDLANRFLAIKNRLKAPESDLYYWIKNGSVDELEQAVQALENAKADRQASKALVSQGAKLVCETDYWKVYHITTFEAAKFYGRDTKWCITGIDGAGDKYWKDYTEQGVKFYFLITKRNYDPRGFDSKFALALYPADDDGYIPYEAFDQQDEQVLLNDIYNINEVSLPGIKNMKLLYEQGLERCCMCDEPVPEADAYYDRNDNCYCEFCYSDMFE